jgi:hypothetical protein
MAARPIIPLTRIAQTGRRSTSRPPQRNGTERRGTERNGTKTIAT